MVWITLSLLGSRRMKGLQLFMLILTSSLVINLGHYTRNYELYGNPLGPGQEGGSYRYANDTFTVSSAASNVIRNLALHIGTPFERINAVPEKGIYQLHEVLGIDPNDGGTTWRGAVFHVPLPSTHEDLAGNPIHLVLILASVAILLVRHRDKQESRYYFVCLLAGFVIFSLYLKWQPWHSRLQLPLFVLWSPLIGLMLSEIRRLRVANAASVVMILAAIPWVVYNSSRPLVGERSILSSGRAKQYFANRPSLYEPYNRSAQFLSNSRCSDIGLKLGGDDWEYPFWVLLGEHYERNFRLEHSNVVNISRVEYDESPFRTFRPCAVIALNTGESNELRVGNVAYFREWFAAPVGVFVRK
jgi:hypothetical protein